MALLLLLIGGGLQQVLEKRSFRARGCCPLRPHYAPMISQLRVDYTPAAASIKRVSFSEQLFNSPLRRVRLRLDSLFWNRSHRMC